MKSQGATCTLLVWLLFQIAAPGFAEAAGSATQDQLPGLIRSGNSVAAVADLTVGTIRLPNGWTHKRTGTKDSERGQFTRGDGKLVVTYDIGVSAGVHMYENKKAECIWYREQVIHGHQASIGLVKTDAGRQLVVTIYGDLKKDQYPANFWATVQNDEDVVDMLLIALSYEGKS